MHPPQCFVDRHINLHALRGCCMDPYWIFRSNYIPSAGNADSCYENFVEKLIGVCMFSRQVISIIGRRRKVINPIAIEIPFIHICAIAPPGHGFKGDFFTIIRVMRNEGSCRHPRNRNYCQGTGRGPRQISRGESEQFSIGAIIQSFKQITIMNFNSKLVCCERH